MLTIKYFWYVVISSIDELLQDSDSEPEDDSGQSNKKSSRKQKSGTIPAWLRDDAEDITDFLDSNAAKNILGNVSSRLGAF